MEGILKLIEQSSIELSNNQLCIWLSSGRRDEDYLGFIPAMSFFVLGFKDMVIEMSSPDVSSPLQEELNVHCQEDSEHWKWFLGDLRRLRYFPVENGEFSVSALEVIWNEESYATRDLVYTAMYYIKMHQEPIYRLVLIELLEAAFAVFIAAMKKGALDDFHYRELMYFGKNHVEKELSHERGSWVENQRAYHENKSLHVKIGAEARLSMELMIQDLVKKFDLAFTDWYSRRYAFRREGLKLIAQKRDSTAIMAG
ncbi:MAG: hypothetical protein OEZ47_09410 [Gammaproteobacteria bacterium]|nr:hypothetical protein [Gammaproteobacteria bacterium]